MPEVLGEKSVINSVIEVKGKKLLPQQFEYSLHGFLILKKSFKTLSKNRNTEYVVF